MEIINKILEDGKTLNENHNKNRNESKMKRLKFKKPFNGVNTALKVIPETYKVNNKVFEMTDGNEHYRVRWEGSLNEGKGVVLSSFHQEALNEDVAKIKHLMGFKSQDTLGNLKGGQRLKEDKTFFDMLKKSQALNEAAGKYDDPRDNFAPDPLPEEWEFVLYDGEEIDTNDEYLLDTILDTISLKFYDSNGLYEPLITSLRETISVDDTHPEIQKLQPRLLAIANKLNTGVAPNEKDTKLVDTILDKYYKYVDKWEPIDHTMDEAEDKPDFLDLDGNGESSVLAEEITFDTTDIDDMVRAIDGKDISVKLEDGVVITGKPDLNRNRLFQLSLQIKTENGNKYFSFYKGKFAMGGNEIVAGMNDESNDWLKSATKIYGLAAMKMYPETFAKHTEKGERPIVILNKDDWSTEIGKLTMAGYKWSSNNDLNSSNDITNMSNYVKFPYIIYVNDDNKTVDYRGEHTDLK